MAVSILLFFCRAFEGFAVFFPAKNYFEKKSMCFAVVPPDAVSSILGFLLLLVLSREDLKSAETFSEVRFDVSENWLSLSQVCILDFGSHVGYFSPRESIRFNSGYRKVWIRSK